MVFFSSLNQRYDIIIRVYWFELFSQVIDVAHGPLVFRRVPVVQWHWVQYYWHTINFLEEWHISSNHGISIIIAAAAPSQWTFQVLIIFYLTKANFFQSVWSDVASQGPIQEFWLGGKWIFFFQGMGFGARLKAPSGSRAMSWWIPRGWSTKKLLNFSDLRSKI